MNSDACQVTILRVAPVGSDDDGLKYAEEKDIYATEHYNTDGDGNGISDGQEVSEGADPLNSNSQTEYVKIWMEAEEGDIVTPMEFAEDANASSGTCIVVPDGNGTNDDPFSSQAGYAEYTFDVSTAGDYIIWGRVIANDAASDSFFVSMDDGESLTWHTKMSGTDNWTWDMVSIRDYDDVRDASNPAVYHLEVGTHTFKIQQREDGTKIDRFIVTDDMVYLLEN